MKGAKLYKQKLCKVLITQKANYAKCKIMQSKKLYKEQDYTRSKIMQGAKIIQSTKLCKSMQGVQCERVKAWEWHQPAA